MPFLDQLKQVAFFKLPSLSSKWSHFTELMSRLTSILLTISDWIVNLVNSYGISFTEAIVQNKS